MITYMIIYAVIGLLLSYVIKIDDGRAALTHPGITLFIVLTWPILCWYLAGKMTTIKYKGRVIWRRK